MVITEEDIAIAQRVFQHFYDNPQEKSNAKTNKGLANLLDISRRVLLPTREEARTKIKDNAKQKRKADNELLNIIPQIRSNRQRKLVGQNIGGSEIFLDRPPKLGTVEANDEFIDNEQIASSVMSETASTRVDMIDSNAASTPTKSPLMPNVDPQMLNFPRSCHICAEKFRIIDPFYDQLCLSCSKFNHVKRSHKSDMTGRVCLLTGARVKIGYCVALKLLRMNATVIVTTRFPHDAAIRYAKEPDFKFFKGKLFIYGLDFRDISMVHYFCAHVKSKFTRLDVLINNAAQTVRRPPQYYEHLISNERLQLEHSILNIISVIDVFKTGKNEYNFVIQQPLEIVPAHSESLRAARPIPAPTSVLMSQTQLIPSDIDTLAFPPGLYDRDDQQIDERTSNSWTLALTQVSTVEMIECHAINTFAPWVIISELVPLMRSTNCLSTDRSVYDFAKYIVNVSAMEGQFYRKKTHLHPHTNMAKAALNMLTRTSASALSEENIFMTAVDTGWITDENPVDLWDNRKNAPPPLDEIDAAMRILDPVLVGINGGKNFWGVFLKNYFPTRW